MIDWTDLYSSSLEFASMASGNHGFSVFLFWVKAGMLHHF